MGETDEQCTRLVMMQSVFEIRFGMGFRNLGCCVLVGPLTVDSLPTVGPKIMIQTFVPPEIE